MDAQRTSAAQSLLLYPTALAACVQEAHAVRPLQAPSRNSCCIMQSPAPFNHAVRCGALHCSSILHRAESHTIQPCCKVRSLALFKHTASCRALHHSIML
eukprot:1150904-Pelagomonas_calceolata.AAC.2